MNRIWALLALTAVVSGCATTETQTFKEDPLIRPGAQIELGAVTVPPESEYELDVAGMMSTALEESLTEHNIAWQGDPAADIQSVPGRLSSTALPTTLRHSCRTESRTRALRYD